MKKNALRKINTFQLLMIISISYQDKKKQKSGCGKGVVNLLLTNFHTTCQTIIPYRKMNLTSNQKSEVQSTFAFSNTRNISNMHIKTRLDEH